MYGVFVFSVLMIHPVQVVTHSLSLFGFLTRSSSLIEFVVLDVYLDPIDLPYRITYVFKLISSPKSFTGF